MQVDTSPATDLPVATDSAAVSALAAEMGEINQEYVALTLAERAAVTLLPYSNFHHWKTRKLRFGHIRKH